MTSENRKAWIVRYLKFAAYAFAAAAFYPVFWYLDRQGKKQKKRIIREINDDR